MASLKKVAERFYHPFKIIEGGTGTVRGILTETEQQSQPSYVFVQPRHVFRAPSPTALMPGMVLQGASGAVFIVGDNGPSEQRQGTIWESFRLFQATGRYLWERRKKTIDPITRQPRDGMTKIPMGMIWCAFEPLDREASDREMRFSFEQRRIIAGAAVEAEDIVDNQTVTKVDKQLGVYIGVLT